MRLWEPVAPARTLAALRALDEAVDDVVTGPISTADAGPANVGEYTPKLDVVTALAVAPVALAVVSATPP
jgi:hypothetical protein